MPDTAEVPNVLRVELKFVFHSFFIVDRCLATAWSQSTPCPWVERAGRQARGPAVQLVQALLLSMRKTWHGLRFAMHQVKL
jgi:hypothetical protein